MHPFDQGSLPPLSTQVDTDVLCVIKWTIPFPSVFVCCKQSKTGQWEGLGTRLVSSKAGVKYQSRFISPSSAIKELMTSYSNMQGGQGYYCQGRLLLWLWELGALRCTDRHKYRGSSTNFCHHSNFLSTTFHNYSLTRPETRFSCESLALLDYNNKAAHNKLAILPCLEIHCRSMWVTLDLLIKSLQWVVQPRLCSTMQLHETMYITIPFHFAFHRSIPHYSPVIRHAQL